MTAPYTERGGIQQVIRACIAEGWKLDSVWDGEESFENPTELEAVNHVMNLDMAHLYFRKGDETGWVFIVRGNAPDEVVNDYTTNLTPVDTLTDSWIYDN